MDFERMLFSVIVVPVATAGAIISLLIIYAMLNRYFRHKERLAMIAQGMDPRVGEGGEPAPTGKGGSTLARGWIAIMVGFAVTLGLLTLGIGPWLLAGLVPMAAGGAILIVHYLGDGES